MHVVKPRTKPRRRYKEKKNQLMKSFDDDDKKHLKKVTRNYNIEC